jgi:hypothetical protein
MDSLCPTLKYGVEADLSKLPRVEGALGVGLALGFLIGIISGTVFLLLLKTAVSAPSKRRVVDYDIDSRASCYANFLVRRPLAYN